MSKFDFPFHLVNRNPKPITCPNCGRKKKFSLYVSSATGEPVDSSCGRCSVCGYNYPPREYFADDRRAIAEQSLPTATDGRQWIEPHNDISAKIVRSYHHHSGTLYCWLCNLFGEERTDMAWDKYEMGVTDDGRAAIYWQKDNIGSYRTGEIITYRADGHRDPNINERWTHNRFSEYELKQCLFGLQHVSNDRHALLVVEAPKNALIGSIRFPNYTWVAVGSRDQFNADKLWAIRHHRIVALPDVDAIEQWHAIAEKLNTNGYNIRVYDFRQLFHATEEERQDLGAKGDIADLLAMRAAPPYELPDCQQLRAMIDNNPCIATLCLRLKLELA